MRYLYLVLAMAIFTGCATQAQYGQTYGKLREERAQRSDSIAVLAPKMSSSDWNNLNSALHETSRQITAENELKLQRQRDRLEEQRRLKERQQAERERAQRVYKKQSYSSNSYRKTQQNSGSSYKKKGITGAKCTSNSQCARGFSCYFPPEKSQGACMNNSWINDNKQRLKQQHYADKRYRQENERAKKLQLEAKKRKEEQSKWRKIKNGTQLAGKYCYGDNYVGGQLPSLADGLCVDITFSIKCPGDISSSYKGTIHNMVSNMGGCYGDIKQVPNDIGCKAKNFIVDVLQAEGCKFK